MQTEFLSLFQHYLNQLKAEIEAYHPSDESLWLVPPGISNSAGNLCCHLVGNLNHFIGQTLGNTGYVRNRPLEFSARNVPKAELKKNIEDTSAMLETVLPQVNLEATFPQDTFGERTVHYVLLHLAAHFNYHLGQINYHRRLLALEPTFMKF
ncbi:MAG: DinB family protein [Bacteroidota bacterium]